MDRVSPEPESPFQFNRFPSPFGDGAAGLPLRSHPHSGQPEAGQGQFSGLAVGIEGGHLLPAMYYERRRIGSPGLI